MKAIKANKVYKVDETNKATYLAQGFDIFDDNGSLLERSPSSTVSRAEYDKVLNELSQLKNSRTKKGDE